MGEYPDLSEEDIARIRAGNLRLESGAVIDLEAAVEFLTPPTAT